MKKTIFISIFICEGTLLILRNSNDQTRKSEMSVIVWQLETLIDSKLYDRYLAAVNNFFILIQIFFLNQIRLLLLNDCLMYIDNILVISNWSHF